MSHNVLTRFAMLLMVFLTGVLAGTPTPSTAASAHDVQAMTILQRMADLLSQAQRLSVTAEISFDVVQDSGETLEFGETRQIVIRRPDRARVDVTKRDGATSGFIFDGQAIAVFNTKENVYATAARPGTLDEAIDYFINDLDMRFPLAELFSSTLAGTLQDKVRAASSVEPASIAGVPCDHVAFRGDLADVQLWMAQGDQPLPSRIGDHLHRGRRATAVPGPVHRLESRAGHPRLPVCLHATSRRGRLRLPPVSQFQPRQESGSERKEHVHETQDLDAAHDHDMVGALRDGGVYPDGG